MYKEIYSKEFPLKERVAETQKEKPKIIDWSERDSIIKLAIDFSEAYEQGIEITEQEPYLWIELFLTDHFFADEGKEQLTILFTKANRVDLSQLTNKVGLCFQFILI